MRWACSAWCSGCASSSNQNQYLNLSFDERLGLLVDREAETRDSRRLALRLKAAKLRQEATVEDLDFRAPRGLDRTQPGASRLGRRSPQPADHWTDRCRKIVCGLCLDACRGAAWAHPAVRAG